MEIITELDGYQAALSQINMNESVMPYVNGRLVSDKAYNKVQRILNCPEMIASHKYLYNLDLDQLTEDEEGKIDQLYKLGCDRGFIVNDLTDYSDDAETPETVAELPASTEKKVEFKDECPCWTVIYSATDKNGQIKTGEAYSNAISSAAAKADVNSKLSSIGYNNITILAIEQCETAPVAEDDMLDGRSHNNHIAIPEADDEESDDETSNETEDATDDEEESEDDNTDDASSEETADDDDTSSSDEDDLDDEESDNADEESDEDDSEDNSDDEESDEDDSDDEELDDADDEESDEKEELDANKKAELKDQYRRTFKNTLVKCKFDVSFNDLTLEQKVKFFTALSKAWTKNEPNEFMTDKEIEQLNNVVVKEND